SVTGRVSSPGVVTSGGVSSIDQLSTLSRRSTQRLAKQDLPFPHGASLEQAMTPPPPAPPSTEICSPAAPAHDVVASENSAVGIQVFMANFPDSADSEPCNSCSASK